jgi:hypothetical protein
MTMETILNLVWLAVTLAALWLWRFRWKGARRKPGHDVRLEAVAMVCVLALLFPVISLTDDLHPEVIPAEAASSKRALCLLQAKQTHGGTHAGTNQHFLFACLRESLTPGKLEFSCLVLLLPVSQPLSGSSVRSGRAPPSLA